jgi:hypothetical protein
MFDAILAAMAGVLAAGTDDDGRDVDGLKHAGPFSESQYKANSAAGAHYEIMLAVRKAHTRLRQGQADEALSLLMNCRKRLPAGTESKQLDQLIVQLEEVQAK